MSGVNCRGVNCRGVNCRGSIVGGSIVGDQLSGGQLSGGQLSGVNFRGSIVAHPTHHTACLALAWRIVCLIVCFGAPWYTDLHTEYHCRPWLERGTPSRPGTGTSL